MNPHCYPTRIHTGAPASPSAIAVMITRARGGRWEEEGGRDEGPQKSDKRAQTNPLLNTLVFNIKREYIARSVVLAPPEMAFELAEAVSRRRCGS